MSSYERLSFRIALRSYGVKSQQPMLRLSRPCSPKTIEGVVTNTAALLILREKTAGTHMSF